MIGRKGFLFCNTPLGAHASAVTYSIVETAKENRLNPVLYLEHLFVKLPTINLTDREALGEYLPWSASLPEHLRIGRRK